MEAIQRVREPSNYTEIRSFTNLATHYRCFILGYSQKAKPLTDYLSGAGATKKKEPIELSRKAKQAFKDLKRALISQPVLQLTRFDRPFLLHTDASKIGLGADLQQQDNEGKWHPVTYGSQTLRDAEKNYHSSKLEFLALLWAVTKQFKEYLIHVPFKVKTDNNPLTYVMTMPNLDATGHQWVGALASYNFSLKYVKGTQNVTADIFSCLEGESQLNDQELEKYWQDAAHGPQEVINMDVDDVKVILDGPLLGTTDRAEVSQLEPHREASQEVSEPAIDPTMT